MNHYETQKVRDGYVVGRRERLKEVKLVLKKLGYKKALKEIKKYFKDRE